MSSHIFIWHPILTIRPPPQGKPWGSCRAIGPIPRFRVGAAVRDHDHRKVRRALARIADHGLAEAWGLRPTQPLHLRLLTAKYTRTINENRLSIPINAWRHNYDYTEIHFEHTFRSSDTRPWRVCFRHHGTKI